MRHLRLGDVSMAPSLKEELAAGASFAELAKAHSTDLGSAESGGDLGWLDVSLVERTFGAEVAKSTAGSVTGPVEVGGGWHLVQIEARRDQIPLSEVEAGLTSALVRQEMDKITEEIRLQMQIERPPSG